MPPCPGLCPSGQLAARHGAIPRMAIRRITTHRLARLSLGCGIRADYVRAGAQHAYGRQENQHASHGFLLNAYV